MQRLKTTTYKTRNRTGGDICTDPKYQLNLHRKREIVHHTCNEYFILISSCPHASGYERAQLTTVVILAG